MTMTTRRLSAALGVGVTLLALCAIPIPLAAQATINTTTLAAAATASGTGPSTVSVASASTMVVGQLLYVDREAMTINAINGTVISVTRGANGTQRADHASGALVYSGPPSYFSQSTAQFEPAGPCTAANTIATPVIFTQSGDIYQCSAGFWALIKRGGLSDGNAARLGNGGTDYTAAGAITVEPGVVWINGTTLAMTIGNPTVAQNGMTMCIFAANASAHTLTYTAGFNGGTTARDLATYGGAIGDGLCIVARAGVWYTTVIRNITFS